MQFNKAIRAINEELSEKWDHPIPLASGNCGMFTISLSRFLTEKKVPHQILIATIWSGRKEFSQVTPKEIVDEGMPGNHYVIKIGDKIVDFQGINDIRIIEDYSSLWGIGKMRPYVVTGCLEDIEAAVEYNTGYSVYSGDFDEVIRKHFMA